MTNGDLLRTAELENWACKLISICILSNSVRGRLTN
jgi:hypothetical protein